MKFILLATLAITSLSAFAAENNLASVLEFDESDISTVRVKEVDFESCKKRQDEITALLSSKEKTTISTGKCRGLKSPSGETFHYGLVKFHKYL